MVANITTQFSERELSLLVVAVGCLKIDAKQSFPTMEMPPDYSEIIIEDCTAMLAKLKGMTGGTDEQNGV